MYKTILVPVDLSHPELGEKTLKIAKAIGGDACRVILLNVVEEVPSYIATQLPAGTLEHNLESAREKLAALAGNSGAEVDVRLGHAHLTILEEARRLGIDLIVLASHRPGLEDYFLGSTAARVVRHADCAVLVDR